MAVQLSTSLWLSGMFHNLLTAPMLYMWSQKNVCIEYTLIEYQWKALSAQIAHVSDIGHWIPWEAGAVVNQETKQNETKRNDMKQNEMKWISCLR